MANPASAPSAVDKTKMIKVGIAGVALLAAVGLIVWNMMPEPIATGGTGAPAQDAGQPGQPAQQKVAGPDAPSGGAPQAKQTTAGDGSTDAEPLRGNYRLAPERRK